MTKLLDKSNEEITLSFSSIIFLTYSALLLPFLIFEIILAFEVAVIAVSEPERNPEIRIKMMININRDKLINVISIYLNKILIWFIVMGIISYIPVMIFNYVMLDTFFIKPSDLYVSDFGLETQSIFYITTSFIKSLPGLFNINFGSEMGLLYSSPYITIGSIASRWTERGGSGAYTASKHAVYAMVESVARQLHGSESNIAVSMLCPGVVDTPLTNPNKNSQPHWLKPETIAASALHIATAPVNANIFDITVFGMKDKPW